MWQDPSLPSWTSVFPHCGGGWEEFHNRWSQMVKTKGHFRLRKEPICIAVRDCPLIHSSVMWHLLFFNCSVFTACPLESGGEARVFRSVGEKCVALCLAGAESPPAEILLNSLWGGVAESSLVTPVCFRPSVCCSLATWTCDSIFTSSKKT